MKENIIVYGKSLSASTVVFGSSLFLMSLGRQFVKIRERWGRHLQIKT